MKKLIAGIVACLALVIVPTAAAEYQTQANQVAAYTNAQGQWIDKQARGARANVGITTLVTGDAGGWEYSFVRLQDKTLDKLIQIGWDKSNGVPGLGDSCHTPGLPWQDIFVEYFRADGSNGCFYFNTPAGYTWGQSVSMTVKYIGSDRGDTGVDGDFDVTFDTTTYQVNDLGWSPATDAVVASVGEEFHSVTLNPYNFKTSYTNLEYQAGGAGTTSSDPFVVVDDGIGFTNDAEFDHTFTYSTGANAGSITYPKQDPLPVIDNFNRADENPLSDGGRWSASISGTGEWGIALGSNEAKGLNPLTQTVYRNDATFPSPTETHAKITVKPGDGNGVRLYCRVNNPHTTSSTGYYLYVIDRPSWKNNGVDQVQIFQLSGTQVTQIGSTVNYEWSAGDTWKFICLGTSLQGSVLHNGTWTTVITQTSNLYALGGYTGFGIRGTVGRVDDFGASALS